jgi:hypothetical protein
MDTVQQEIAQAAAALVVDEGLDYGQAKVRALKALGLPARTAMPDNRLVEAAVREHIALFHADTQPRELRALRELALLWMERLAEFSPLVGGAVWHGTATRHHDVYLQLFSDDPKAVEVALTLQVRCEALPGWVGLHLLVNDSLAQRGALLPDEQGRKPRGDIAALRNLLASHESDPA